MFSESRATAELHGLSFQSTAIISFYGDLYHLASYANLFISINSSNYLPLKFLAFNLPSTTVFSSCNFPKTRFVTNVFHHYNITTPFDIINIYIAAY